jgi:hypothetical protein
MSATTKKQIDTMVELLKQGMTDARFTGITVTRSEMPQASFDVLFSEDDDEDRPDRVVFSAEIAYHRVVTEQGGFGFWLFPYPLLDLRGTRVSVKAMMVTDPGDLLPADWSFVEMHEQVFKTLFAEFAKVASPA